MAQRVLVLMLFFYSLFAAANDTVLKLYRPFGEVVEQVAPVVKTRMVGECDTQSQLILREDAWRCLAKGRVFDPCFVKAGARQAICPQSPWAADSVQIDMNDSLNNEHHIPLDMSRAYPWAVELVNGEQCQAVSSSEVYDAMPVRYRCGNSNMLIGYLQRCKTTWSMLEKTPKGVVTVEFRKVWF